MVHDVLSHLSLTLLSSSCFIHDLMRQTVHHAPFFPSTRSPRLPMETGLVYSLHTTHTGSSIL